jgi:excisionase family DNA binding protein
MEENFMNTLISKVMLAQMLGISIFTVDAWVSKRKNIPFIKVGGRVMFSEDDVVAFIESNKKKPFDTAGGDTNDF